MKKTTLLIFNVFILYSFCFSQLWLNEEYLNKKSNINFYDVKTAFEKWSEGKDLSKYGGWKQWKRYEWFYDDRVDLNGNIMDPSIAWKESIKLKMDNVSLLSKSKGATWTSISPSYVPDAPDFGSSKGVGRINCIEFHPTDTNTFWVGASQGGVWVTTDGGQNWNPITDNIPSMNISGITVDKKHPDTIYIATGDIDRVYIPADYGGIPQYGVGVLKSVDGGATWNTTGLSLSPSYGEATLIRKVLIHPDSSDVLLACGINGIYRSIDGGDSWIKSAYNYKIIDVEPNPKNEKVVYLSTYGSNDMILKTSDFGLTWTESCNYIVNPSPSRMRIELAIAPSDTNRVYAITTNVDGGLYSLWRTDDGGANWSAIVAYTDLANHPGAIEAPNVLHWYDGGKLGLGTMANFPEYSGQGFYDLFLTVDPTNSDKIYSGGINIWGSADAGLSWDIVSYTSGALGPSVHADQHYAVFQPETNDIFVANDGGVYKTPLSELEIGSWDSIAACLNYAAISSGNYKNFLYPNCYELPTNWTDITAGLRITEIYRLGTCRSNSNVIAIGAQDNGSFLLKEDGTWIKTYGGDGMESIINHNNPNIVYATTYNGSLFRSEDGGDTFTGDLTKNVTGTGAWVTPFVMSYNNPDVLYTAFNQVWKSTDKGATWTELRGWVDASSYRALAVAKSNENYIYAAREGNIFVTTDGGAAGGATSWKSRISGLPKYTGTETLLKVNYITIHPNDPQTAWVSFTGYYDGQKIYKTSNAGMTWQNISGNLPNCPVHCIAYQEGVNNSSDTNAIYVGTDLGVFYTNDSLQNTANPWIQFNDGLPNVIVTELEINYNVNKLRAATYGRGLWESDLFSPSDIKTSISEKTNNNLISITPNPTSDFININANYNGKSDIEFKLFTVTGKKVIEFSDKTNNSYNKSVDISSLDNGIYIMHFIIGNIKYTKKIIKE